MVLGLKPTRKRATDFAFGLISSSVLSGLYFCLVAVVSSSKVDFNTSFTGSTFINSTFWILKSVLYEEFLFRGALLYIGIKKIGFKTACILSSIAFGVYHWFSYAVVGNIAQMIYTFILTGIGGLLFAFSYAYTKSMWLPIGLHLGWNLISVVIFSQGPLGNQMLICSGGQRVTGILPIMFFIYQIAILPFVTYLYLRAQKYAEASSEKPS